MNAAPTLPVSGPLAKVPLWLQGCVLFVIVFLAFSPSVTFDFINYDDPEFILENPNVNTGLSAANLKWAFASPGEVNLWNPLSYVSHQLDVSLFGLNPAWHHATNVFWHALASALLFLLARKLTGSFGWACFIALVWAVHPQKIQSVAWVSERKDVLSGALFFASILCFAEWKSRLPKLPVLYGSSLLLFIAAALAKPSVLPLPLVLVLFYLKPGRIVSSALSSLRQLAPFFICAAVIAAIVVFFQSQGTLSEVGGDDSPMERLRQIIISYVFYPVRFVLPVPSQLLFAPPASRVPFFIALTLLPLFLAAVAWIGKRESLVLVGALVYTLLWLPVSGVVPVSHYFVADRYSYLPQIGIVLMLAGFGRFLFSYLPGPLWPRLAFAIILVAQFALLQIQLPIWKNSRSLFGHEMAVNPLSFLAPLHYGETFRENDPLTALSYYRTAHEKAPHEALPLTKMGLMQLLLDRPEEALLSFRKSTESSNQVAEAWNQLLVLEVEGKLYPQARETVRRAVERFPRDWSVLMNGGNFHLLVMKEPVKALPLFLKAHEIRPSSPDSIRACARCYRVMGDGVSAARFESLLRSQ